MNYSAGGVDTVTSSLHWGPLTELDRWYWATGSRVVRRTDFASEYHTFGLEWNENYMMTCESVRSRQRNVRQIVDTQPLFAR
jgi:hypothetical protein